MHLCPCSCGSEVVNKLSPVRWKLTFDGENISLSPSISNSSISCQFYYWIRNNKVIWATSWSHDEINKVRNKDRKAINRYFSKKKK